MSVVVRVLVTSLLLPKTNEFSDVKQLCSQSNVNIKEIVLLLFVNRA
jgi:hypothetical protein